MTVRDEMEPLVALDEIRSAFERETPYYTTRFDCVRAALLANAPSDGEWIPCAERMPERGAEVLFRGANWKTAECGFLAEDGWEVRTMSDEDTEYYLRDITHWMPLPAPPEAT